MLDSILHVVEEHEGRGHGGEDTDEYTSYLHDWYPRVVVGKACRFLGGHHREDDDKDEYPFAQELDIEWGMLIGHCRDVLGVDEHGGAYDAEQPQDVDLATQGKLMHVGVVGFNIFRRFLLVVVTIYNVVGDEKQNSAECPFGNEVKEPCEFSTL